MARRGRRAAALRRRRRHRARHRRRASAGAAGRSASRPGVKMHSGVFARQSGGRGARRGCASRPPPACRLRSAEIADVDEDALRDGRASSSSTARVACRTCAGRAAGRSRSLAGSRPSSTLLCAAIAGRARARPLLPARAGHHDRLAPAARSGPRGTLLGVDAVRRRSSWSARDLTEQQILALIDQATGARLVVGARRRPGLAARPRQPAAQSGGVVPAAGSRDLIIDPRRGREAAGARSAAAAGSTPATTGFDARLVRLRRVRRRTVPLHDRARARSRRDSRRDRCVDGSPVHGQLGAGADATRCCAADRRDATAAELFAQIPAEHPAQRRARPAAGAGFRGRRCAGTCPQRSRATPSCEDALSFLGGGCWQHHVPAICDEIAARTEFLTSVWGTPSSDHGRNPGLVRVLAASSASCSSWTSSGCRSTAGAAPPATRSRMAARMTGRVEVLVPRCSIPERLRGDRAPTASRRHARATSRLRTVDATTRRPARSTWPALDGSSRPTDRRRVLREPPTSARSRPDRGARSRALAHAVGAEVIAGVDPISLGVLAPPAQLRRRHRGRHRRSRSACT